MARNRAPRPYTGRRSTKPLLIVCLVALLTALFLLHTYRTNADFHAAVTSIAATLRGERQTPPAEVTTPTKPPAFGDQSPSNTPQDEPDGNNPEASANAPAVGLSDQEGLLMTLSLEALQQPQQAVQQARSQGARGVVVDLKLQGGVIAYNSALEEPAVATALSPTPYDLQALATLCRENDLMLIGRLSTFLDHLAAVNVTGACVAVRGGVPFLDGNYQRSLDPYREQSLSYLSLLVDEVCAHLDCLLLSDLAFPSYGKLSLIDYPSAPGKAEQLLSCLETLQERANLQDTALWIELPSQALTDATYASASGQTYLSALSQEQTPPVVVLRLPVGTTQQSLLQTLEQAPDHLTYIPLIQGSVERVISVKEALSLNNVLCEPG